MYNAQHPLKHFLYQLFNYRVCF